MPTLVIINRRLEFTDAPGTAPDWTAAEPLRGLTVSPAALAEIGRLNRDWYFTRAGGRRADLQGAYLRGADLQGADLQGAYLRGADLQGADLQGAYLRGAYLQGADLRGADLRGADLQGADLRGADLRGADLRGADLPAPTIVLLAFWGALSGGLTADLMRLDAACHPDPTAFDRWAAGGSCPYEGVRVQRAAEFKEVRELWVPGPCPRPYDLMVAVLAEKCPDWTDERRAAFEATFAARVAK
jgi:hypothetical protein